MRSSLRMGITAITLLPHLDAGSGGTVDGPLGLTIYPSEARQDSDEIAGHLNIIFQITRCRSSIYVKIAQYDMYDSLIKVENEFEKLFIPFRFCVLANRFISYGQELTFEHTHWFTFTYATGTKAQDVDGYQIFKDGKPYGYQSKEKWISNLTDASAAYDRDWYQKLSTACQSKKKLLISLDWFSKSFRRSADMRDRTMALSISLEGILCATRTTRIAERKFRKILRPFFDTNLEQVLKKAKQAGGILSQSLTRNLLISARAATGSRRLTKFIQEFYEKGSRIRHGDVVFEDDVAWFGEDSHIRLTAFMAQLSIFILQELYVTPRSHAADEPRTLLRRWEIERLEQRLISDRQRFEQIKGIIEGTATVLEKLELIKPLKDFHLDRSVPRDQRGDWLGMNQKFFRQVNQDKPEFFSECASELSQFLEIPSGTPDLKIGQRAYELRRKLIEGHTYREGQLVLIHLIRYCAWLYGWN